MRTKTTAAGGRNNAIKRGRLRKKEDDMMDATYTSILRLWEQGLTRNQIANRLDISKQKVSRVLITSGAIETEESALYNQGCTVEQIMQQLGKSRKAVVTRLPYLRGMYDAEYPTPNAIRIRRWREKQH